MTYPPPPGGGTYNADDPLIAPWYIPGWTVQHETGISAAPGSTSAPWFPPGLAPVRVTGSWTDMSGEPLGGYLTLMPSESATYTDTATGRTWRLPARPSGIMNPAGYGMYLSWNQMGDGVLYLTGGRLDALVFPTDSPGLATDSGAALAYYVTEHMLAGRQYQITVPSSSTSPADINSLIVAGTVTPYQYDPVNPAGNAVPPQSSPQAPGQ